MSPSLHPRLRSLSSLAALTLLLLAPPVHAQTPPAPAQQPASGVIDLTDHWRVQQGDNPAFAQPAFDDSAWPLTSLAAQASIVQPGSRWYRHQLDLPSGHPPLSLLIIGPDNQYQVYLNGTLLPEATISGPTHLYNDRERPVPLPNLVGPAEIAIHVIYPRTYTEIYQLSLARIALGPAPEIESQRQIARAGRYFFLLPSIAINLAVLLAGCGALLLFFLRRRSLEYLWLGLYFLLQAISVAALATTYGGLLPMPVNNLIGDPLSFPLLILQIEFTYAFTMRRIGIAWRIYEALLLVFIGLSLLTTAHLIAPIPYLTAEAAVNVPVAIILPILLLTWFLRGNREAGWLILPSLLPAAGQVIADIATSTQTFDWTRLSAWLQPITLGPVSLQLEDLADLGFLLAIGFVMVLRFTRISQEQARTSAELAAAREIQQQLVPVTLPEAAGCRLEAAYLPAQEVGGDFYLGLAQTDGSLIILVGDVSGKGLKAAMTGVLAIGAARTLASENLAPGPLLTRLNHEMTGSQNGGFVTCVCVRITANGAVSIANAGHVAPYWNGEEVPVESGLPLGILASIEYTETLLQLIPGDRLTLLSDGVVEAQNARRELFGFDRTRAISRHSAQTIAETAQQFGQEDDITVLTVTFQ